ncbi:hypothetical protein jhhlp_007208 [Lomentospora prolificans]|uniref:Telomere length regulation protein conserved domain-containing protein n=1 Tax=Lomentospora prolificans TaxID=41688 RepID=A0A2N3N211_9PEZI|nr:hypothetical protein jhhlp_007208 [Lomentospora prolificans]
MDDFFTPVSTTYTNPRLQGSTSNKTVAEAPKSRNKDSTAITTPEEALDILKSQPDYDDLLRALRFLTHPDHGFNLSSPGPVGSQITTVLVNEIAPDYWPVFQEPQDEEASPPKTRENADLKLLLLCLQSAGAINGILRRLQTLIREMKSTSNGPKRPDLELNMSTYVDILSAVLDGDDVMKSLWRRSAGGTGLDSLRSSHISKDIASILGRGVIVSTTAEADFLVGRKGSSMHWVSDTKRYVEWLARSLAHWMKDEPSDKEYQFCVQIFVASWSLGYAGEFLRLLGYLSALLPRSLQALDDMYYELFASLLLRNDARPQALSRMLLGIHSLQRNKACYALLAFLSKVVQERIDSTEPSSYDSIVSAAATLIKRILPSEVLSRDSFIAWLVPETSGATPGSNVWTRRAVLACFSDDVGFLAELMEKAVSVFGDTLWINWAPLIEQQALAETILISSAYLSPPKRSHLQMIAAGPTYTRMISNRLETPNNSARVLGMVVGETISSLVHAPEQRLDFKMSETDSEDAKRYKSLAHVHDQPGPIQPLLMHQNTREVKTTLKTAQKPKKSQAVAASQKKKPTLIIEEVSSGEDDDIIPYAKPDSDAEDSDEDPTLVRRDKVKAPVYIRNLITYLRDTENYDKQETGLKTAPSLIRRKANFGAEVRDHAEELATLLVGLQDKYDLEDFYELRLDSMVALIISIPKVMAPWFIKTFFQGDYSLSQRGVILAALGLAARELAGFEQSGYVRDGSFPSKKLAERMEQLFLGSTAPDQNPALGSNLKPLPPTALDSITKSMATSFLGPLAADAADKIAGPDSLKLSTLKSKVKGKNIQAGTPNVTSDVLATQFLRPLVERYQYALSVKNARVARVLTEPYLLTTYLKTVAIIYHAGGPTMPNIIDLTAIAWNAVLTVRSYLAGNLPATAAGLTVLAVLLDVNEFTSQRLAMMMSKQITDTIEWLDQLLTVIRGGDKEEDEVRLLASGVMVRLHQLLERYRMDFAGALY